MTGHKKTYNVQIFSAPAQGAFRLRLHEKEPLGRLVYQIHLIWQWYNLSAVELEQAVQRRRSGRAADGSCIHVLAADDDLRLRKLECAAKPTKRGQCNTIAAGPPSSTTRAVSLPPQALPTAPFWLEEALAGRCKCSGRDLAGGSDATRE